MRDYTVGPSAIPDEARAKLPQHVQTLRIIVASLAMGVIAFGGYAIVHNLGKIVVFAGEPLNVMMLAFGAVAFVLGMVLPPIIFRHMPTPPQVQAVLAQHKPEVAEVFAIQGRIQTSTIIGCALFEGAAFANLVAYLQTADTLNLAMAGLLLGGVLSYFPRPGQCERRIERELRRSSDEASLRGVR